MLYVCRWNTKLDNIWYDNSCYGLTLILNLNLTLDPFADAIKADDQCVQDGLIHIRIQQRNGRKTLTTVQGIAENYDKKKIVKACKKVRIVFASFQW